MLEDLDTSYPTLPEVKVDMEHIAVANKKRFASKPDLSDKIINFIYLTLFKFAGTKKVKGIPMSKNFIENLKGIMKDKTHIHHSHITGKVIGYAHSYCNFKVRENKPKITVVAYNIFRMDFFFLMKGLRAGVRRTRDICIGGKSPTDINFTNIGKQITFLNKIKYFQQSLGALANSLTDSEKSAIKRECEKFIKKDENL